jgi:hypothetical protein
MRLALQLFFSFLTEGVCNVIDRLPRFSPSLPLFIVAVPATRTELVTDVRTGDPAGRSAHCCFIVQRPKSRREPTYDHHPVDVGPTKTITSLRPYQAGKSPHRTNSAVFDSWPLGQLVAAISIVRRPKLTAHTDFVSRHMKSNTLEMHSKKKEKRKHARNARHRDSRLALWRFHCCLID